MGQAADHKLALISKRSSPAGLLERDCMQVIEAACRTCACMKSLSVCVHVLNSPSMLLATAAGSASFSMTWLAIEASAQSSTAATSSSDNPERWLCMVTQNQIVERDSDLCLLMNWGFLSPAGKGAPRQRTRAEAETRWISALCKLELEEDVQRA